MILGSEKKEAVLQELARLIDACSGEIIAANKKDMDEAKDLDPTLIDRLLVDNKKVDGMIAAVKEVIAIEDPQGKVLDSYQHPNGMKVENKVVPFGKILIIYESRPDVTIEAAISAFKAGNKILLKGGKESRNSNLFLVELWHQALKSQGIPEDFVTYLNIDRTETQKLLQENTLDVDLIIPRGGEGLINYIRSNTSVPLIVSGRGNNFIYVHENADLEMALSLIMNGKSRLSVCNAIDKVLFNENINGLKEWLPELMDAASQINLEVLTDGDVFNGLTSTSPIKDKEIYYEEFLSPKILFSTVKNLDEAVQTINRYSGGHSGVIVSSDTGSAEQFLNEVDCAAVYHNASSRFTDGGQFGFGAEIAISTQKLHFRGPVGLSQLVTNKWFVYGQGQVR